MVAGERSLPTSNPEKGISSSYVSCDLSERTSHVLRRSGFQAIFKRTIRICVVKKRPIKPKQLRISKIEEQLGVVYMIMCGDCDWSYIGNTGRSMEEFLGEHESILDKFQVNRSEIT